MPGALQGNLAAGCLFSVGQHSPPHLKQRAPKLCLPEEPYKSALLSPGSPSYTEFTASLRTPMKSISPRATR